VVLRTISEHRRSAGPVSVAAALAIAYLIFEPHSVDLAAHVFRAQLFAREGFTIWNGNWYAGHHTPAYSVLFPPLAWLVAPAVVGALSTVAATALFDRLVRQHFGERARLATLWFALGTGTILVSGRLPFGLGVALGLGALLALQRRRPVLAPALAGACSLASPLAGLFLALAAVAHILARAWRPGDSSPAGRAVPLAIAAIAPALALALAFPEGGREPFVSSAFLPLALIAAGAVLLAKEERVLRIGAALYCVGGVGAFVLATPIGGNVTRLGALFGGPVLAAALLGRRLRWRPPAAVIAGLLGALALWQWSAAGADLVRAVRDPAARADYYRPLVRFLAEHPGQGRIEVVFTKSHWEAAEIASRFPLARGWQRQLDIERNPIFYNGELGERSYARWLSDQAVRFVAVPEAELDYSAEAERALIEREPSYLRLRWSSDDWRVYEVAVAHPMVIAEPGADIVMARLGSDSLLLRVRRAGTAVVRVRWSPYWRVRRGCVERAGSWIRVIAPHPGLLRVTMNVSPRRLISHGRRCR